MILIQLKPKKEESLHRFHPWVFSGAIQHIKGKPKEGDVVEILDSNGNFLAVGHYQIGSIAVRILSFEQQTIDRSFWENKIRRAYEVRQSLGLIGDANNTYRLIHGEGDSLAGLIVDVYGDTAVMQAHSVGMHETRSVLAQAIVDSVPEVKNVYYKSETTLPFNAPITPKDGYLIGQETTQNAVENGLKFHVDWLRGQKTGFFIDQRENRMLLEQYAKNKAVLNMFCYTGGFSVYAMRGGANLVHSVDSSAKAIELTDKNVAENYPDDNRHASFVEDAFKFLNENKQKYDLIILDPPAFAKHREIGRASCRERV